MYVSYILYLCCANNTMNKNQTKNKNTNKKKVMSAKYLMSPNERPPRLFLLPLASCETLCNQEET